jgi:molybdopterin/thiamine biosynthesis adenylyltransferase
LTTAAHLILTTAAAGEGGLLTVTDDDTIEKSNLSRQFLFRWAVVGVCVCVVAVWAWCGGGQVHWVVESH